MNYSYGDTLSTRTADNQYLALFVAGIQNDRYLLAFFDYHQPTPPTAPQLEQLPIYVNRIDYDQKTMVMFYTVTIPKPVLENSPAVNFVAHLDMQGRVSAGGLIPAEDVTAIVEVFERWVSSSEQPTDLMTLPLALMLIGEIRKFATLENPFKTVYLYKSDLPEIHYWQIYGSLQPLGLVYCWGEVGRRGQYEEITDQDLDTLKTIYREKIEEKKAAGFKEYEDYVEMTLQFRTEDAWGSDADLDFRNEIWEYLDYYLFWTGNGAISGGDIGSGTVNLFFHTISPAFAVRTITAALKEKQVDRPYLIAIQTDDGHRVIYPPDHPGDFGYALKG